MADANHAEASFVRTSFDRNFWNPARGSGWAICDRHPCLDRPRDHAAVMVAALVCGWADVYNGYANKGNAVISADSTVKPQALAACRFQPTGRLLSQWAPNRARTIF